MFRASITFRAGVSPLGRLLSTVLRPTVGIPNLAFSRMVPSLQAQPTPSFLVSRLPSLAAQSKMVITPPLVESSTFETAFEDAEIDNTLYMDSVLRKRRLKMKKHKLRKRRREQRSLKKRLGKL